MEESTDKTGYLVKLGRGLEPTYSASLLSIPQGSPGSTPKEVLGM